MKPKLLIIASAIAASLALLGFLGWQAMQPKFGTATPAEIRAVTAPELLKEIPDDPAAQDRYKQLLALFEQIDTDPYPTLAKYTKASTTDLRRDALVFWTDQGSNLAKIRALLAKGPIQCPRKTKGTDGFPELATARNVLKCVAVGGLGLVKAGNYKAGTDLLILGIRLSDSMMQSRGVLINYLVDVALIAIVDHAIQAAASEPGLPVDECKRLLAGLPSPPLQDASLKVTLLTEYQQYTIPLLSDPKKVIGEVKSWSDQTDDAQKPEVFGTFDPIETAKLTSSIRAEELANCDRPLSELTHAKVEAVDREAKGLPEEPKDTAGWWEKFKYRFKMNNGRNTLGIAVAGIGVSGLSEITTSCRWRAYRSAVRIHLAANIYRAGHGGALPKSSSELGAILGGWPLDPYNDKPMIYDRDKAIVYSVGDNLIDDHGAINTVPFTPGDIGVSLTN